MIPAEQKYLKISKLDAARQQLECAVELYFNECDPVSIHTLCMAANKVLRDLNKGKVSMIKDEIPNYVIPGKEKEAIDLFNKAENFFKHADRNSEEVLNFNPDYSEFFIWNGCQVYRQLTGERPDKMVAFSIWFKNKYDHLFVYTEEEKRLTEHDKLVLNGMSKQDYFGLMLQA